MTAYTITPGQTRQIPINQGINAQAIEIWNGTPFDLDYIGFGVNSSITLVAGTGHIFFAFDPGTGHPYINTGQISITANNNNNVTGTGVVNVVIYKQGEAIPAGRVFPVPIPTQVVQASVSSVQTLSNETSTLGAEIIDIGTSANNKMLDIFNDHFVWSVIQSAVVHQVLKGQTSGNPLQIGQANDIAEVLGKLTVDQLLTAVLGITLTGGTLNYNVSATAPTVSTNGQTIATAGLSVSRVTCNTNGLTGFILQSGTVNGQQVIVLVEGVSGSFTFDVAATSHVAGGTGVAIGTGFAALFVWDSSTSFWYVTQ